MVPGWYPDRFRSNEQCYWTGTSWSARRRWVVDTWIRVDEPPETVPLGRPDPPRSRRPWWIAAAAVCVAAAATTAAFAAGARWSGTSAPSQSATPHPASPATLPGIKTSPGLWHPRQPVSQSPASDSPGSCTVSTPSDAYPVSGRGIDAIKSTLPSRSYLVSIIGGLVGAVDTYPGTTDASGNGLGSFTVPDLGQLGSVIVTFASGTSCHASFIVEAKT